MRRSLQYQRGHFMRSIAGVANQPANEELGGSVPVSESLVMMLHCRGVVV